MNAEAIKVFRVEQAWSQQQLADALGVGRDTIATWETGHHRPKGARLARLRTLVHQRQAVVAAAPAHPKAGRGHDDPARMIIRIAEALRLMGLKNEGHGRASDRTLKTAIKEGRLPAWKGPGTYKPGIPEWYFYRDDFDRWQRDWYVPYRDPRLGPAKSGVEKTLQGAKKGGKLGNGS